MEYFGYNSVNNLNNLNIAHIYFTLACLIITLIIDGNWT